MKNILIILLTSLVFIQCTEVNYSERKLNNFEIGTPVIKIKVSDEEANNLSYKVMLFDLTLNRIKPTFEAHDSLMIEISGDTSRFGYIIDKKMYDEIISEPNYSQKIEFEESLIQLDSFAGVKSLESALLAIHTLISDSIEHKEYILAQDLSILRLGFQIIDSCSTEHEAILHGLNGLCDGNPACPYYQIEMFNKLLKNCPELEQLKNYSQQKLK